MATILLYLVDSEGAYEARMYAIVVFTSILLHTCQRRQIHRSEFLTANIKMIVLWDVTLYSLVDIYDHFGNTS
jgi:hypothetical protein